MRKTIPVLRLGFLPAFLLLAAIAISAQPVPSGPMAVNSMIESVPVQGGSFIREGNKVSVSSFVIGKYELTQAQYQELMGTNPSKFQGDGRRPVELVTWYNAVAFCNALSAREGLQAAYEIAGPRGTDVRVDYASNGWRLPTEAEWEYAARGGIQSKGYTYAGSNDLDSVAWYVGNAQGMTHLVGEKAPNELGIFDLSGNVWEWCQDWYGSYPNGEQTDPRGAAEDSDRVKRGGGWRVDPSDCAVGFRLFDVPSNRTYGIGFRVLRRQY